MKTTQYIIKGDYFRLNNNYSPSQRRHVMQVSEVTNKTVTVESGKHMCMTKTPDEFELVTVFNKNDIIHDSKFFEDLRN